VGADFFAAFAVRCAGEVVCAGEEDGFDEIFYLRPAIND